MIKFIKWLVKILKKKEIKNNTQPLDNKIQQSVSKLEIKEEVKMQLPNLITKNEILMGRDKEYPLNSEQETNLDNLWKAINKFRVAYGKPLIVTSGYRPGHYNKAAGGATNSSHLQCLAVDLRDNDGSLATYCLANLKLLEDIGLWLEDPRWTKIKGPDGKIIGGWVHLQIRPASKRVFIPFSPTSAHARRKLQGHRSTYIRARAEETRGE
jgi:hypothetical protein